MGLNQWRNTDTVIFWFKGIRNKHLCKFVVFGIKEFYPYITENLQKNLKIWKSEKLLSKHTHTHIFQMMTKQLLNTQENHYSLTISKLRLRETGLFDVKLGAHDGAEVCELVGNHLLYELSKLYEKKDIGLYRDDRLAVLKNKRGPETEKIKKSIQAIFRENGLKITIQCDLKTWMI